jgi:hypothetical protein
LGGIMLGWILAVAAAAVFMGWLALDSRFGQDT